MANAYVIAKYGGKWHIYQMPPTIRSRFASRHVVNEVSGRGVKNDSAPVHTRGVSRTRDLHHPGRHNATIPDAMPERAVPNDCAPITKLHALAAIVGGATASIAVVSVVCACAYFGALPHCRWHHIFTAVVSAVAGSINIFMQAAVVVVGIIVFFVGWEQHKSVKEVDPELATESCCAPVDCHNFF